MAENIYIVGHKSPDTDSVCAAISLANLKNKLGQKGVIACRAGKLNKETEFVLDYFKVDSPHYLPDVHLRVKDILKGTVLTVSPEVTLYEAWQLMKKNNLEMLPVVNEKGGMLGIVTGSRLPQAYMGNVGDWDFRGQHIKVQNVVKTLEGTLLVGNLEDDMAGFVRVATADPDCMGGTVEKGDVLLIGKRPEAQKWAIELGVSALILTMGASLSDDLIQKAKDKNITVISVKYDTFNAVRLLPLSLSVGQIMRTEDIVSFHDDELISDVRQKMLDTRFRIYPVLDEQERVVALINQYNLLEIGKKNLILVDHNEIGQAVNGAEQAQILEVVDHHRVGGIQTAEPILFRNEPVGSTCTIVANLYRDYGFTPEKEIAGIMLSAILSDTVIFRSPTCTDKDKEIAQYLEEIVGVNAKEFGVQMFKASSNLQGRKPEDMIVEDLKEFTFGDMKVGVGQVSVMGTDGLEELRPALVDAMHQVKDAKGWRFLLLMVTDLLDESTELFIVGEKPEIIAEAFEKPVNNGTVILPGVLSRKKQVVPPLTSHFNK